MQAPRILLQLVAITLVATLAHSAEWHTDYDRTLSTAKATNKRVLLSFVGSDWCGPCIAMHRTALSKAAFTDFAEKNLILVEVDFPRHKSLPTDLALQNDRLMRQYEIEQLPTLVLLNADGKMLGKVEGYANEGPADIITWIEKASGQSK